MSAKFKAEAVSDSQSKSNFTRLRWIGVIFTILGIALFSYFIFSIGFYEILHGVRRIGFEGFAFIIFIYFLRILIRAASWKLSVSAPYSLSLRDCVEGVMIGEAMSSIIPLGILVSGTSKAVSVRKKMPIVVALSTVATENLFYSLVTGLFISFGGIVFLRNFELSENWILTLDILIGFVFLLIVLGILMVIRQWHFLSEILERLYERGILHRWTENGRMHARLFENLIYGFYRQYPQRFAPIFVLQILFHALGILEVWFILNRLSDAATLYSAFLLESISRVITVVFKLIPFLIGVDEAGAQFVTETLALGAGLGVTLAIVRKGRIIFWAILGVALILKRGLSFSDIKKANEDLETETRV
ncbi:MAG TPA: lysylphosphatidylglycerol synthase transmembrane domain-containing protein [Pyrinomonadaceae bacterium]|jgi:hypothetical protein